MDDPIVFLDTETTGLDPERHEIWEVGLIEADGTEHHWFLPVDLGRADPIALKIGRFYERSPQLSLNNPEPLTPLVVFAAEFAKLTAGKHLVGAVISFDEERLRKLLRANGACPDWHYHLVDVEALAMGYVAASNRHGTPAGIVVDGTWMPLDPTPPWNSGDLTEALSITVDESEKHTALGDARWAKAIYEAVMGE